MASKHSKSFFDFRKSSFATRSNSLKRELSTVSLPFKIIISALVLSLLLSSVFVASFFSAGISNKKLLKRSQAVFESYDSTEAIKNLAKDNEDIKGWIKIDGTAINGAVCHGKDDSYYINHNQLGKKSRFGALFLSESDTFERKDNDRNIVIFGNNMTDGSMFGELKKYRKLKFYKQNPFIELYYGDNAEIYLVFAVMITASSSDGEEESYNPTKSHFATEDEFNSWYSETCERSTINTTVSAKHGDDFLTLVTVADDFDGARLVVIAKKIDEFEASHTNVLGATVNANPKYPKIWYENKPY